MKRNCISSIFAFFTICLIITINQSCKTEDPNRTKLLPVLTTTAITKITQNTAITGGNITSDGGLEVSARGVCWSLSPNPTINDSTTKNAAGTGEFTSNISNLLADTTYYVRAYATNSDGSAYGLQVTFKTLTSVLPVLTTTVISDITVSSATSGGNITFDGGSAVTARGICWSTTSNPTIALSTKTLNGEGTGIFTSNISNLITGTTYYLRAYATNKAGTGYSTQTTFRTQSIPILTTTTVPSITGTTLTTGGNITNDGGALVTVRGVCWSTTANPNITDNKTSNGAGTGVFTSSITGLTIGNTYYVRAYATNAVGTSYGNEVSFRTASTPTLSTNSSSNIAGFTATSGGNVTSDGGSTVSARGVCWSTNPSPTIANSKTSDITGLGIFTSSITGLTNSTIYYVRAYATNAVGTAYGNEVSFTTSFYAIGVSYLGGKIAYLDTSGEHGFVCALNDQGKVATWWNGSFMITGATNYLLETTGVYGISKSGGRKNNDAIINKQGAGSYAASICAALTIGGAKAGDWYLPSMGELNQMYINKTILGGFAATNYWSSTESLNADAIYQDFSNSYQSAASKGYGYLFRAVRAF